jgi:oxygen-independent coproporphyrinogen-3 oxidase
MGVIPIVPAGSGSATADVQAYLRPGTLSLPALPPLTLYVHFPWCVRKCPYCDFNSHESDGGIATIPEAEYLRALRADIESALPLIWGRRILSVFIGGGTPSLLSGPAVETMLSDVRALLQLEADCEITLEANPGTAEADRFAAFRAAGVNRLSLGIQSFSAEKLRALGRIHDRDQALRAVEFAQRHFDNFNLDLMYGLPRQTLPEAQDDIALALDIAPPHLSLYQLTLEQHTVFAKFPPPLPDEDTLAEMQDWIDEKAAAAGYRHYEVSAYAQPGRECRHNLNYWGFGDYLGVGPGAHSKISFPHRIVRQVRFRQPTSYLSHGARGDFIAESTEIAREDPPFPFMLNAMRLVDGVPSHWFTERAGLPPTVIQARLNAAEARGLLTVDHQRWAPTALGWRFLSDLQSGFLPGPRS